MERTLNITDARAQFPALVKEVAANGHEIVITTRNEPKAIIIGYEAFRQYQRISERSAKSFLKDLVAEAQLLIEATQEGCRGPGDPEMYLFLTTFNQLMHDAWKTAEKISEPHALLAFSMFAIGDIYLSPQKYPDIARLSPKQLGPIAEALAFLTCSTLTMEEAGAADLKMMKQGIQTMYPLHIDGDLNALYEGEKHDDLQVEIE